MKPDISICMAARNAEQYIEAAIESIVTQLGELSVELVVVNHGSTDRTFDLAVRASKKYHKRMLFSFWNRVTARENEGPAAAKNIAINLASADIIRLFDADDIMLEGSLVDGFNFLKADPNLHAVFGNYIMFYPDGNQVRISGRKVGPYVLAHSEENFLHPGTVTIKKEVFERSGGFDETLRYREDRIWFVERLAEQYRFQYVPKDWLLYRIHDSGTSRLPGAEEEDQEVVLPRCRKVANLSLIGGVYQLTPNQPLTRFEEMKLQNLIWRNPGYSLVFPDKVVVQSTLSRNQVPFEVNVPLIGKKNTPTGVPAARKTISNPKIAGITTIRSAGGGSDKSLRTSLSRFESVEIVATCPPSQELGGFVVEHTDHVVPHEQVADFIEKYDLIVDDGNAELGRSIPVHPETRWVRAIRNGSNKHRESVSHVGPTVYTSICLADHFSTLIKPGDAVISNGVPTTQFENIEKEPGLTVIAGRISQLRGLPDILRCKPKDARVIVAGNLDLLPNDEREPWVQEMIDEFPDVEFPGYVHDVEKLLARTSIAVCWSSYGTHEGYWRQPFEAMAQGCYVICNPVGDMAQVVSSSLFAEVHTMEELREEWEFAVHHPNEIQEIAKAGQRYVLDCHNQDVMIQRWTWLLQRELGILPEPPEVTLCLTYGYPFYDYLVNTLRSIEQQTLRPQRVILGHDISAGVDPGLPNRLAWDFPWVEYLPVDYDHNQGSCIAKVRNATRDAALRTPGLLVQSDAEVILPCDAIERIAATLTVYPNTALIFGRERIVRPNSIPTVLFESTMSHSFQLVEGTFAKAAYKNRKWVSGLYDSQLSPITGPLWKLTGPIYAAPKHHYLPFDENFRGWGGEDCDWSYRMLQTLGTSYGCIGYHQEHPQFEDVHQISREESHRNSLLYLSRKHNIDEKLLF